MGLYPEASISSYVFITPMKQNATGIAARIELSHKWIIVSFIVQMLIDILEELSTFGVICTDKGHQVGAKGVIPISYVYIHAALGTSQVPRMIIFYYTRGYGRITLHRRFSFTLGLVL